MEAEDAAAGAHRHVPFTPSASTEQVQHHQGVGGGALVPRPCVQPGLGASGAEPKPGLRIGLGKRAGEPYLGERRPKPITKLGDEESGLDSTGLCYLLKVLLDNTDSCMELLDVGYNPGCLAECDNGTNNDLVELLAQLLVIRLRELKALCIDGTRLKG